jgi:uncharacterized protein (TIGR03435 family)
MHRLGRITAVRKKLFLCIATLTALTIPIAFSTATARLVQTQSQQASVNLSDFKFEVASIKPAKDPDGGWGLNNTTDGIRGLNVPLLYLVKAAYGIYEDHRYLGAPNWINSEHYDFEAKMENSVAEQFRKLPRAQRIVAEQHMLQVLLEERFNLKAHPETKEFPVYFLVIAKNGSKLQELKPDPNDPSADSGVWGGGGAREGVTTLTAHIVPIEQLASQLTSIVGRTVLDKTELTGRYDLTLKYTPEYIALRSSTATASEGQPAPSASDSASTSIFKALQDQLGLKLESGKAPIEIIAIDHIERASGN